MKPQKDHGTMVQTDLLPEQRPHIPPPSPDAQSLFLAGKDRELPDTENLLDLLIATGSARFLYQAGLHWPRIHLAKAEKALIRLQDSEYIYRAGRAWRHFDTKAGLDALTARKDSRRIYYAGNDWKSFDFRKGQKALTLLGDAESLFYAGCHWPQFDFEKGMAGLLATGNLRFLFQAGKRWAVFDHEAAWRFFEKEVRHGAPWRAKALEDRIWKKKLRNIFRRDCGLAAESAPLTQHTDRGPGRWEITFGTPP